MRSKFRLRRVLIGLCLLHVFAPAAAQAQPRPQNPPPAAAPVVAPALAPVLEAPPGLDARDRAIWDRFLIRNHPRAAVLTESGRLYWFAQSASLAQAESSAMAACQRQASPCTVWVRDNAVVAPGRAWAPPTPPGAFSSGLTHEIVPDARMLFWGPGRAAGVYVWGHGRGTNDSRGVQPQAHVRHFNNAGWDIVRFDRHPNSDDADRAAGWLRDALPELRRRGYARVIVGGQSRGGWNALQMLDTNAVDAVIAMVPGAHGGQPIGNPNYAVADQQFEAIARRAATPRARVAMAIFRDDPFLPDAENRARLVNAELRPRVGALLFIDRPDGFSGHGAAAGTAFNDRFGPCIFRLVTQPNPVATC